MTNLQGLYMSEKDLELLTFLHKVKVASYAQIGRDIYCGYHKDSVGKRLRKLEDNRLIHGGRNRLLCNGKKIVSLTKHGFDSFIKNGTEVRIELKSDAKQHDLVLVDIRHHFLKSAKTLRYATENQIQTYGFNSSERDIASFLTLNSDAVIELKFSTSNILIPIEYEGSLKKEERYESIVQKYYNRSDVAVVLYVTESQGIMQKIQKVEKTFYNGSEPKFFYKKLQDLLQDDTLRFYNFNQHSLALG